MRKGEEEEKRREIPATSEILLISVVHVAIEYDMQVYCIGTCRLIIRFCYVHATWYHLKSRKHCTVFLPNYKNTSGSLENKKCCWNTNQQASVSTTLSSSFTLSQVFLWLDRNMEKMSYFCNKKQENHLFTLIIKNYVCLSYH